MFDRPTDSWYMYMRPFNVAILLQLREKQRQDHLRQLEQEDQQRREQQYDAQREQQEQQEQEKEKEQIPSTP
jgi:hypothetical protein